MIYTCRVKNYSQGSSVIEALPLCYGFFFFFLRGELTIEIEVVRVADRPVLSVYMY